MSQFVDECNLNVRAGDGGAGCVSFRREAHVARGGPDGGDGGDGGDVWLVADHNVASLLSFRDHPHRRAGDGTHGQGKGRHGKAGSDLFVPVPVGTTIARFDGTVLGDLVADGDRWLAARGGRGGRGNARFLSNRRRAPGFAEQGEVGEERWLHLEVRLMADVALVGFPNVGKSTLISVMTAARPKIADYPFTTLVPNLGVVQRDDGAEYTVADIPGLVEGAADGRGLGIQFLRHVERARVLVLLVDVAVGAPAPSPTHQLAVLRHELGAHAPELLDRPQVVVASRVDVADRQRLEEARSVGAEFEVSGATRAGVAELADALAVLVAAHRASTKVERSYRVFEPDAEGFTVARSDDGSFVVDGREAQRAVALSDLTSRDALDEAHRRLVRLGVLRALARAGAAAGDTVHIGGLTFDFVDENG